MDKSASKPSRTDLSAAFLAEAAPADALEAMLTEQMAAVHAAGMRCLARAEECTDHPEIEALYLRQAARLMHLFARQTQALDRRRIAAEDRAGDRCRTEQLEESSWRQEKDRAKRLGEPLPPCPPRGGNAWPAWPVRADGRGARGRGRNTRSNGAAAPT